MIKNKKGFTLIELIVVIAILAVLAIIIVPQILNQIEVGRTSFDRTTERTVQSAVHLFFAQYNTFPAAADYSALATPLAPFLDLGNPPAMPAARSTDAATNNRREFRYNRANGDVYILPPLPPVN